MKPLLNIHVTFFSTNADKAFHSQKVSKMYYLIEYQLLLEVNLYV